MTTHLLIIDPQNDFCDPKEGTLYVPGADADMTRLAALIDHPAHPIDAIHVTLDSHHLVDIAHPAFWLDRKATPPAPFTTITAQSVRAGDYRPKDPQATPRALAYLEALEATGRYPHTIWPPHCLIGGPGHNVYPPLFAALTRWEAKTHQAVDYIIKGTNIWTEHFSAIRAEVPDPQDPTTELNDALITTLAGADRLLIAGEAGSHCVAHTVRDLADALAHPTAIAKLSLLEDAISPVPGFEPHQHKFLADLTARGMQLTTTTQLR